MKEYVDWVEVGDGQEACVFKGRITEIEGMGGNIKSDKPIVVAKRVNRGEPVHDYEGHNLFCKHLTIRLLDEHFQREGKYSVNHIPVPLGSFKGGYYYCFAEGLEGFPLEIFDDDYRRVPVDIDEWDSFVGMFSSFGLGVGIDVADAIDGRTGKNVIFSGWDMNDVYETGKLHKGWKRIDFGAMSCPFDYERFKVGMDKRRSELEGVMSDGYRLAYLSARFYAEKGLTDGEYKELESLIFQFRKNQMGDVRIL